MKAELLNLLQTKPHTFNDHTAYGVNGRNLHQALKVGRDYSTWIKARIKQCNFVENIDYLVIANAEIQTDENLSSPKRGSAKNKQSSKARQQRGDEYIISVETAKHLCLMEKNDIGRAIRQHFIEAESQLRQVAPKVYRNTLAQTQARLASIDHNREMTDAIKESLNRNAIPYKPFYYSREQEMLDSLVLRSRCAEMESPARF